MSETLVVIMNVSCTQWFLTGGARLPKGASSNFQGGASPYMLCNIERFLTGMCPFQTWFSAMWPYTCMILTIYSTPSMFFCDETRGGSNRPPTKTYESNFIHHNFVQIGKQHSRYQAIFSSIVCHSSAVKYTSPLLQQRGCYEI